MHDSLTQEQKDDIRNAITNNTFSAELEIAKLMALGFEPAKAKELIVAEIKAYKKEMFDVAVKQDNQEEVTKLMFVLIFVIALIGPMFNISSPIWYIIAIAGSGIAGYFGYREKPIAGIVGAIIATIVFPFAYTYYFEGRSSFIKIEMAIPMILSAIPAVIAYYTISWIAYPKDQ